MTTPKSSAASRQKVTALDLTEADGHRATSSSDRDVQTLLTNQLVQALKFPAHATGEDLMTVARGAMKTLEETAPKDTVEAMLISQMVAAHSGAMDCLRRAMIEEQTFAGREMNLKHATKLMSVYARQVEALDKHRGKGAPGVMVGHVNVHSGGQAVVGSVTGGDATPPRTPAIADQSGTALPMATAEPVATESVPPSGRGR